MAQIRLNMNIKHFLRILGFISFAMTVYSFEDELFSFMNDPDDQIELEADRRNERNEIMGDVGNE
jgi:hypothetical protein